MSKAKLSMIEVGELFKAATYGFSDPMFGSDGSMFNTQFRSWKRLQRLGLAEMEGGPEVDDLIITDKGRQRLTEEVAMQLKRQ